MSPLPITTFTSLSPVDVSRPSYDGAYSPDGSSIIFDAGGLIWVATASGTNARSVYAGRLGRFSRLVGGQILFTHDIGPVDTNTQLWSSNLDGTNAHVVANGNFAGSFAEQP